MATAASDDISASAVPAGPAHVAVVSFLAARAAPTGGFWIALAGGVALARAAERRGARLGFGASAAAMLETVAIIGPARFGIPLTQALTAPMLGRLEARGVALLPQILACAAIRLLHNTATTAFFIWVIAGGLDAYAGTYDAIGRRVGIDVGTADAVGLTLAGLLGWAAFASTVQVLVYRRGLRGWDGLAAAARDESDVTRDIRGQRHAGAHAVGAAGRARGVEPAAAGAAAQAQGAEPASVGAAVRARGVEPAAAAGRRRRFDPRAITLAAAVAFAALLSSTSWLLLAAVAAALAIAWVVAPTDNEPVKTGLLFAAILAAGALLFALGGGLGLDEAARRAIRAALLVLVATWMRAAAGAEGLREVSRRVLGRLRRVPAAREAALVLDRLESEGRLAEAGRALADRLSGVEKRPIPFVDAVLGWVVGESERRPQDGARADTNRL